MTELNQNPAERDPDDDDEELDVEFGQTLYTDDGSPVGTVHGIDGSRIVLTVREGVEMVALERHQRSGQSFGEAELMWRCMNCGEMGEIEDGLPEDCPNCGVEREELMYWTED